MSTKQFKTIRALKTFKCSLDGINPSVFQEGEIAILNLEIVNSLLHTGDIELIESAPKKQLTLETPEDDASIMSMETKEKPHKRKKE